MLCDLWFHCREGRCTCFNLQVFPLFLICMLIMKQAIPGRIQARLHRAKRIKFHFTAEVKHGKTCRRDFRSAQLLLLLHVHLAKMDLVTVPLHTRHECWFECSHGQSSCSFLVENLEMGLLLAMEMQWCHAQDTGAKQTGKSPSALAPSLQSGSSLLDKNNGFGKALVHGDRLISYCTFSACSPIENPC